MCSRESTPIKPTVLTSITCWTPETVDFVLRQGDSIYNSVRHEQEYFDYTELPRSVSLPGSDHILSSSFVCQYSGFLHSSESSSGFYCFTDALSAACCNSAGCLVTINQTSVAIICRHNVYYLFDSHARNCLGQADSNGTAVLLSFSSIEAIHSHMKQLHHIADAAECLARWPDHARRCQFDVVAIDVNSALETAGANITLSCPYLYSSVVSGVSRDTRVNVDEDWPSLVCEGVRSVNGVPVVSQVSASRSCSSRVSSVCSVVSVNDCGSSTASTGVCSLGTDTSTTTVSACLYSDCVKSVASTSVTAGVPAARCAKPTSVKCVCSQCGKQFANKRALNLHEMQMHRKHVAKVSSTGVDGKKCVGEVKCVSATNSVSSTSVSVKVKCVCTECGKEYKDNRSLSMHQRRAHCTTSTTTSPVDVATHKAFSVPVHNYYNPLTVEDAGELEANEVQVDSASCSSYSEASSTKVSVNVKSVGSRMCMECGRKCKDGRSLNLHKRRVHCTTTTSSTNVVTQQPFSVPIHNYFETLPRTLEDSGELLEANDVEPDSESCSSYSEASTTSGRQRCDDCGKFFVNLARHRKCSKRLLDTLKETHNEVIVNNTKNIMQEQCSDTVQDSLGCTAGDFKLPVADAEQNTVQKDQRSFVTKRKGTKQGSSCMKDIAETGQVDGGVDTVVSDGIEGSEAVNLTSPIKTRSRVSGSTRKDRVKLKLEADLKELKGKLDRNRKVAKEKDPLLEKLTEYHNRLLSQVDNVLTEKVSQEVKDVLNDLSQIDDDRRPHNFPKEKQERLTRLTEQAKQLQMPEEWRRWCPKEGTDQYEYNEMRLQYWVQYQLPTALKHCKQCGTTGVLVGVDQIDCDTCYDCMLLNQIRSNKVKSEKEQAWASVRPKSPTYPKQVSTDEELPQLYAGDRAVIAISQPVVCVQKRYFLNCRKLQQVSITLMQDAQQTWCKVLPRTDLTDWFVVIERTSANGTRKYIVANPDSVRKWLLFLFENHPEFIRMEKNGDLRLSEEALSVLQSQSELATVHTDVDYESEVEDGGQDGNANDSSCHSGMPSGTSSSTGVLQPELESGFSRTDVYTFDKFPYLYLRDKDVLRLKEAGQIEIIQDHQQRVPIYNVSATTAFPYLYPRGEKSPLDFGDFKMSRYLLKKQMLWAYEMADAKYKWEYAEDDVHMMFQYARLKELMVNANATWYLQESPDVAHLPMDDVIKAFKEGFTSDESIIDSKMPGLSSLMAKLPNSRENWFSQRLGIETMARDLGEPNLFLTLSNDPRSTYDTRALLYQLEHGQEMPLDHPFELDTERFTELMSRFAPQMSIYLCRKTKMFLKAFLCDICGIPEKEPSGDWMDRDTLAEGYYWARVEFTETRGVQHWHCLAKLPFTLEGSLLSKVICDGRKVRSELRFGNIKPGKEEAAWEIIECGLLASRYVTLFADSISAASFYSEHTDTDSHDAGKVVDIDKLRQQFVKDYKDGNINMATHPLMRRFCDEEFCDENRYVEMAKVAAVSCIHNCIEKICGGSEKDGSNCRFDFPKNKLNYTVPAVMQVNATQMEVRMLPRRTCTRVSNVNPLMLMYWRSNHDVSVLIDGSHKMRYATKYAAKSGRYNDLLNEIIEYLSERSTKLFPTSMKHVLSQLLLADVNHRAFMSKQELSYNVMDLPLVTRTFADVEVVGFYRRAYLNVKAGEDETIVYSDRTDYSAYAERCSDKTEIVNRKNVKKGNELTKDIIKQMNFREFAETITHEWNLDTSTEEPERSGEGPKRRVKSRDVNSGHWVLKRRQKRRHIRFSTVLYTDKACNYKAKKHDDSTSFFSLELDERRQLYRAYMELVCYVPWAGSPEESFLSDAQRRELEEEWDDPERDERYSLRRLEMFFQAYMEKYKNKEVAPVGSQWRRDNQYSYSMYLTMPHNSDVHQQRCENHGMLKARYEADDELKDTGVDLRYELYDEADSSEYPTALSFFAPDAFKELMNQKPTELSEVSVAFPTQSSFRKMEKLVSEDKSNLFMAKPPPCEIAYKDMTEVQRWAVDLGLKDEQKIMYLCGKAGSGKTQVALKICERLSGRVQAAAVTGKAAALLGAPTVHGMFGWNAQYGDNMTVSARKASELQSFYSNIDVFVIDEVNVMSAAMLAQMHHAMTALFNPNHRKGSDRQLLPFGGKKVIFLGDPSQLKPVMGEPIYGEGSSSSSKPAKVRGCRGKRQRQYTQTAMGQELYRKYLVTNCVMLNRSQRSSGLLQQICDRLRNGTQTQEDLDKLTCRRRKFPTYMTDFTLHYENEECTATNIRQLWSECSESTPPDRVYLCKATYYTTKLNESVVNGLAALPPKLFNFAADVLCVSIGCDVRLIKNIDVAAGLVNNATGTVVNVIYDNADCSALFDGKHPPPYCIVVNFAGFRGFLTKEGARVYPFPNQPHWVPIYKQKFVAARSDLPSWIKKKQEVKHCYRIQFPLDLCRAMTCHKAQGQTLSNCTVSVDLGLNNPDRQLPQDMGSIVYVACTRVPRLENLFVSPIFPDLWEKIGTTAGDIARREVDADLRKAALDFASENGMYAEMKEELDWEPDYSGCKKEWEALKDGGEVPVDREKASVETNEDDWLADCGSGNFRMCMKPVRSERHIGMDQGCRNFAMVAVDKEIGKPAVVVAAENYDLQLNGRFTATQVLTKLKEKTELMSWMQQSNDATQVRRKLPTVDRVVVHIEQMSILNPNWKRFGSELGKQLQKQCVDLDRFVVKLSSPHLFRPGGIFQQLGKECLSELKSVPVTQCSNKRRFDDVEPSSSDENDGLCENESEVEDMNVSDNENDCLWHAMKVKKARFDNGEPYSLDESDGQCENENEVEHMNLSENEDDCSVSESVIYVSEHSEVRSEDGEQPSSDESDGCYESEDNLDESYGGYRIEVEGVQCEVNYASQQESASESEVGESVVCVTAVSQHSEVRCEDMEQLSSDESDGCYESEDNESDGEYEMEFEGEQASANENGDQCETNDEQGHVSENENGSDGASAEPGQLDYREKKKMSAAIFRCLVYADAGKQEKLRVNILPQVQKQWQNRIKRDPKVKLDDVGDALLHGLNEILCGSSDYRQLVPSKAALTCNRTVVIAVCADYTYWCAIYCTWNIFTVEEIGCCEREFNSRYYNSQQTVADIKKSLIDNESLHAALTDMAGGGTYQSVDMIKTIVKQLKGFEGFKGKCAGALTKSAVMAAREICDEAAGSDSEVTLTRSRDGVRYTRTIPSTSQQFQVISSAGKLTNSILSCFNWMSQNAKTFVEKRTFSVDEKTKLCFFDALCALAQSSDDRLELIQLSDSLRQKLADKSTCSLYADIFKRMSGYLILLGISKNEPLVKAVASNYRRSVTHHPKENMCRSASGGAA